jgi:hypothetical protein
MSSQQINKFYVNKLVLKKSMITNENLINIILQKKKI